MFSIEIIGKRTPLAKPKAAVLDFDGTISLIREGWQNVMSPFFVKVLKETPRAENPDEIKKCVDEFVALLTGKQTVYQCIRLAEEVEKRGGTPLTPLDYKDEYHRRLSERIESRIEDLHSGGNPLRHVVPGSYELLELLRKHGILLCLASGTDEEFVIQEAELLQVSKYFNGGIYGAQKDYKTFSKEMVIKRIIEENNFNGAELLGFGDGYVEIENIHNIGGFAVGVASNEAERSGVDEWKRNRLIKAGADWIIPDYSDIDAIEQHLFLS
ncbi:MAG: HAD hydrolase-like protein [Planctomycetaceae bacterium]|nr:HAD hydrolase-like protein [Planctomycetaceae bacterium]